jgi:hypothetical protein
LLTWRGEWRTTGNNPPSDPNRGTRADQTAEQKRQEYLMNVWQVWKNNNSPALATILKNNGFTESQVPGRFLGPLSSNTELVPLLVSWLRQNINTAALLKSNITICWAVERASRC